MKTRLIPCAALVLALTAIGANAQQKVSDRVAMTSGDVAPATDILPIVDISAGTAGSKKITIDNLFTGWGMTTAGAALCKGADAPAQRTSLGLGTAATLAYGTAAGNLVRLDPSTAKLPAVDGSLLTGISAGVTGFTGAQGTTSPNGTIYVSSMTASATSTHCDVALVPKGTSGSIMAAVPDSTATGGNKRGAAAVDWQPYRASAGQVASGSNSTISGGASNTASGSYATVTGGFGHTASATGSTVGGGQANTASGIDSIVCGGNGNAADGRVATITGGLQAKTRAIYGAEAHAAGYFGFQGDAQRGRYYLRKSTTDATAGVELLADGSTAGAGYRITLDNNTTYAFHGIVVARTSGGDSASWVVDGCIERGANAAATALVGTVTSTAKSEAGSAAWSIAVTADTTNGNLKFAVTGEAGKTIRWFAWVDTAELNY